MSDTSWQTRFYSLACYTLVLVSGQNVTVLPSVAASPSSPTDNSTATILGGVSLGLVGLILVGFIVKYFRSGGAIAGVAKELESKKEEIKKVASMLPLTDDQKATLDTVLDKPESLLPAEAQQIVKTAIESVEVKTD
jgi:hypothetical protein